VEASALQPRVKRSTASSARSNVMAKEGHVNHDVSNVPVEARQSHDRKWLVQLGIGGMTT